MKDIGKLNRLRRTDPSKEMSWKEVVYWDSEPLEWDGQDKDPNPTFFRIKFDVKNELYYVFLKNWIFSDIAMPPLNSILLTWKRTQEEAEQYVKDILENDKAFHQMVDDVISQWMARLLQLDYFDAGGVRYKTVLYNQEGLNENLEHANE